MKPGTKFKLECEVDRRGFIVVRGRSLYDDCGVLRVPSDFASSISDVREPPEPRKRFVDVDGTEYEVLQEGDTWESGDLLVLPNGGRTILGPDEGGGPVSVGNLWLIGLRRVKP